jgi:hypothetical protein
MHNNSWQVLYRATVPESDREKLQVYLQAAEDAINGRSAAPNGNIPCEEQAAMGNALSALSALRKQRWRRRVG